MIANGHASPRNYAADYLAAGLSVISIRADGTKSPAMGGWLQYQTSRPTMEEINNWFELDDVGVAVIHGAVSGNSELIDIDNEDLFGPYCSEVERLIPGLIDRLTVIKTPRPGFHLIYRSDGVEGNQKLAQAADGKTLIETRGSGGYALAPGSPGGCHETGRTYDHFSGPQLTELPTISPAERSILFRVAASLNEIAKEDYGVPNSNTTSSNGLSPGDDYNQQAAWSDILTPNGWTLDHSSRDMSYWCRPGKAKGWSATTGAKSTAGNELFCCFSSNAHPFQGAKGTGSCTSYTKFAAYAALNHDGDFRATVRQLASEGYGDRPPPHRHDHSGNDDDHQSTEPERELITYSRITSKELADGDYSQEYLIKGTMVAGQPFIIAGPQKTLKTTIIVDMAVSLAIRGCFLGRLPVSRACRVAVMTGESGLSTIQETAIRVCAAAGKFLCDISNLIWSPDIPKFGNIFHLEALKRFLTDDAIEVLFIDPAYLCMPGADAGNVMIQGELLRGVSEVCRELGVTMVLAHHTKKHTGRDAYSPGELADIAWSGFAEFARQWMLINRRKRYVPGTGDHKLWLSVGGSAGHSALWAVDVTEGVRSDSSERKWDVELNKPADSVQNEEERKQADKAAAKLVQQGEDLQAVLDATASLEDLQGTKTDIKDATGINSARFNAAFATAVRNKQLTKTSITKGNNREYPGYKLAQ